MVNFAIMHYVWSTTVLKGPHKFDKDHTRFKGLEMMHKLADQNTRKTIYYWAKSVYFPLNQALLKKGNPSIPGSPPP